MNTGTHNPNFQNDYQRSTWSKEKEEAYMLGINKKDFFSILKNYHPLDRYDEEVNTELIISDNLGNDVYILFKPTFNVTYSDNFMTGVPTYDKEETHILIEDIVYTKGYDDKVILNINSFTDEEYTKIEDELRILCK